MNRLYDTFIRHRRTETRGKAEHLKDLLEPRYKNRASFDGENLTGLFDVSLIHRIDQCKDFLLIVGKTLFPDFVNVSPSEKYFRLYSTRIDYSTSLSWEGTGFYFNPKILRHPHLKGIYLATSMLDYFVEMSDEVRRSV